MVEQPKILVVDDEEAICEGCSRIFSRQGFEVSKSSNPSEGLSRATEGDYAAVLLDIKMPEMSGLDFLAQLRDKRQDVPVILMTGFPTMPNAISAVRLGASGYVTKPFTPEEITQAVHRFVPQAKSETTPLPTEQGDDVPVAESRRLFWNETWVQAQENDVYRAGVLLPGYRADDINQVELPGVGEVVYQGLPMARVQMANGTQCVVPAPVTGVVETANEALKKMPLLLATDPCGRGWIADICATRGEEDLANCSIRRVLVVSNDLERAAWLKSQFGRLGCAADTYTDLAENLAPVLAKQYGTVLLDATQLDEQGPKLAGTVSTVAPNSKIVVAASAACPWEADYRERRVFYYAVDAFADNEMVAVLDSAFRTSVVSQAKPKPRSARADETIAHIRITNRNGTQVTLIAESGLLYRNSGLGGEIRGLLYDRLYPIQTMPGLASVEPRDVLNEAHRSDRVIVLLRREANQLPATLIRNSGTEFAALTDDNAAKVTTLVVQPADDNTPVDRLDERTVIQLARHIVREMESA